MENTPPPARQEFGAAGEGQECRAEGSRQDLRRAGRLPRSRRGLVSAPRQHPEGGAVSTVTRETSVGLPVLVPGDSSGQSCPGSLCSDALSERGQLAGGPELGSGKLCCSHAPRRAGQPERGPGRTSGPLLTRPLAQAADAGPSSVRHLKEDTGHWLHWKKTSRSASPHLKPAFRY